MTDESKALINVFFGKTQCERNPYGKPERMPENISVLGAGLMGAGIAAVSVLKQCVCLKLVLDMHYNSRNKRTSGTVHIIL